MGVCHHIDWDGLQILMDVKNGPQDPKYKCLLCEKELTPKEYKELIDEIRERKNNDTLSTWRTPKGNLHQKEDCPNPEKCEIHEADD